MLYDILPTKIWKARVNNFETIQQEISQAIEHANWDYHLSESRSWGKTQKFERSNPFDCDFISENNMMTLTQEIVDAVKEYDPKYEFGVHSRPTSWITKYDKGDYSHIHNHMGYPHGTPCLISGAYYYKLNEQKQHFFFQKLPSRMYMDLQEGDLLLFPSWLEHGVLTNDYDDPRIVLSFNLHF